MRTLKYACFAVVLFCFLSCGTIKKTTKENTPLVAGYTLKNKKELMQQKVLHKKTNTVIAKP